MRRVIFVRNFPGKRFSMYSSLIEGRLFFPSALDEFFAATLSSDFKLRVSSSIN